ncbi:MAG: ABC transporter permease [Actinomycetota bacterium]|nr:ABC transporter permease [Actinomycetota bacterium]
MNFHISWGIARRSLMLIPRQPSTFFPSLMMPVFLTISFAGAFSGIVLLRGFPAAKAIDWFVPMTALQGAAFAGITTGMGTARDMENGFYDRFLLSPAPRMALLLGPLIAAVLRAFIPLIILLLLAFVGGANFRDGWLGVGTLVIAGLGFALAAGAWAVGLALRFRTQQIVPLMQSGTFLIVFLSTAQMPLELLGGWLYGVARVNPMTYILELARQGFLGQVAWSTTWPGLLALTGLVGVLGTFAVRGMQKVTP